jgi:putative ABC transport system ATP-binding protein
MQAVVIKDLVKDFQVGDQSVRVLHGLNASIRMGELTMLVGPSGCGKTTLISMITGILSATQGDIELLDQPLMRLSDREKVVFRRRNIGFIFQQYNLLTSLTAAENAALPLVADGVEMTEAVHKARHILEQIGMEGQTEKLPRQLSGGQQQRVAIARALVHNPRLVVCDEPTAALDAKTGQAVMNILCTMASDKDRAVIVVTHDNRIYHFANRILEMSDGRLVGDFKTKDFLKRDDHA